MYFPFLRGRQYDLLALKELAQGKFISEKIIPIIEPIKISSTFKSTIQAYVEKKLPIAIVLNPSVSQMTDDYYNELINLFKNNKSVYIVLLFDRKIFNELSRLNEFDISTNNTNIIIVFNDIDVLDLYNYIVHSKHLLKPLYTLIPESFKRCFDIKNDNLVILEDRFHKLSRNVDYYTSEDEFFSDIHLWYQKENFKGFGDYSIVGKDFNETGFAPRAVAIHIVYVDKERLFFRVRHFISDNNHGIEDIAGKFYEAITKLNDWHSKYNNSFICETRALSTLLNYATTGYYPGLPTIKKLSIMHHIELVNIILTQNKSLID